MSDLQSILTNHKCLANPMIKTEIFLPTLKPMDNKMVSGWLAREWWSPFFIECDITLVRVRILALQPYWWKFVKLCWRQTEEHLPYAKNLLLLFYSNITVYQEDADRLIEIFMSLFKIKIYQPTSLFLVHTEKESSDFHYNCVLDYLFICLVCLFLIYVYSDNWSLRLVSTSLRHVEVFVQYNSKNTYGVHFDSNFKV